MKTLTLFLLGVTLLATTSAFAQLGGRLSSRSRPTSRKQEPKTEEPKKTDDTWLWIKNIDVYPVNGMILRNAEIMVKNDKIFAIGRDLDVPEKCDTLDGLGMRAYPGLVALNGQRLIPSLRGGKGDNLDPLGMLTQLVLAHGITTVISGTTAVKLDTNSVDKSILRGGLYTGMQYSSRNPSNKKKIREDLKKALIYLRATRAGMKKEEKAAATKKLGGAGRYLPLLEGKQIAVFNVDDHQDIVDACSLVESFGFRAVIRGAAEGWTAPGAMGRANVSAILTPRLRRDPDDQLNRENGSNLANAAILHDHGVVVAIATQQNSFDYDGQPGRDALAVAWDAGAAVGGGLPEDAALKAITLNAARIYALDDRIGSLEVGKDADIVICDGEMLHYKTQVYWSIVNGKVAYDRDKVNLFRHIRPRDPKMKKGEQWWPRPLAPMPKAWEHDPAAADKKLAAEEAKRAAKAKKKAEEAKKKAAAEKKAKGGKKKAGTKKDKAKKSPTTKGKKGK